MIEPEGSVHGQRANFGGLVLGCIDSYDSESRRIFSDFSRSTVAPIGRKKSASTFLLPKKNTFGGEPPSGAP